MVPAGTATQTVIDELGDLLEPGDTVIDGGNSRWTDDEKHAAALGIKGIGFVDAGVSGGVWGLQNGYALMVGGDKQHVEPLRPIFEALSRRARTATSTRAGSAPGTSPRWSTTASSTP